MRAYIKIIFEIRARSYFRGNTVESSKLLLVGTVRKTVRVRLHRYSLVYFEATDDGTTGAPIFFQINKNKLICARFYAHSGPARRGLRGYIVPGPRGARVKGPERVQVSALSFGIAP